MKEEKRGREEVEDWKEGKGGRRDRNRIETGERGE